MYSTGVRSVGSALGAVTAAVDALVESASPGALGSCSHEELTAQVRALRSVQARLEAVMLSAVREVDARGSHVDEGLLTTGAWLRAHARMSPREATGTVRTARVLGSGLLADTATALAAGKVDPAAVREIARGVAGAPHGAVLLIESEALAVASESDPRAVAALMKRFQQAIDPDASDEAALLRWERRGVTLSQMLEGSFSVTGTADEVSGAIIATAVDVQAGPPLSGDTRTAAARRLDALVDICRQYLASADSTRVGGGRPHLILTVDQGSLAGEPGSPGGTLSWAGPVAGSTARRIGCDAKVTRVTLDEHGEVADLTTGERRFFTWAQRKAMIARDGDRCAAPYCDRPVAWADGHHLMHWADGGPTTVENGALPCAGHHTLVHEGGWSLERLPDGRYLMRHRDGRVLGPEPTPPGHRRPLPHRRE